jgi:hypothetical protein
MQMIKHSLLHFLTSHHHSDKLKDRWLLSGDPFTRFYMKNFLLYTLIVFVFSFLFSCDKKEKKIAISSDYAHFLKKGLVKEQVVHVNEALAFWTERLARDTGNYVDMLEMASCRLKLFKLRGNVMDLQAADSLLRRSAARLNHTSPEILFAVSQTSVTQHRFRDAELYNRLAADAAPDKYTLKLLEFDTKMELGEYAAAYRCLQTIKDRNSFDYLIRMAKYQDHKGKLDAAIELMEQAFEKIKGKNKSLYCWALSNLGDMYGHAGRVQESYAAYISVLQKDPAYIYALKGIAWIAYSHDRNTTEAKRILQYILSETNMPDLWLTLAEIEEWEGNREQKEKYTRLFTDEVKKPGYGDMYNKYLIRLYTEDLPDLDKALFLTKKEVANRPTPETFDWLAWVHYKRGELKEAYAITRGRVYKQTYEPDALYHTALIFLANGRKQEAKEMLMECKQSAFEIGPLAAKETEKQLSGL